MSASFDVSKNEFKENKDVWFDDANLTNISSALFNEKESKNIKILLKNLKGLNSKSRTAINSLEKTSKGMITNFLIYDNAQMKKGILVKDSKKYYSDFIDFLVKDKKKKLKTFDKNKEKLLIKKLKSQSKSWETVIDFISISSSIKEKIVKQLNKIKQLKTFIKTDSGFRVVGQEGFTAISDDKIVKLVDRLEFTKNLFTTSKDWDIKENFHE